MYKRFLIVGFPPLSFIWLFLTVLLGGIAYPNYSHSSQFIGELAATGVPNGGLVNYFGFIPTEIFMLLFIFLAISILPKTRLLVLGMSSITLYAVALCVAAVFPCDFGCRPVDPSLSHNLHLGFGMSAYLFGIVGIILLAIESKKWPDSDIVRYSGRVSGIVSFILLLNFDPESEVVGLIQRFTETILYAWFLVLAVYLSKHMSNGKIQPTANASAD